MDIEKFYYTESKEIIKFNEILTLIIKGINKMYIEHEMLYKKDKYFFYEAKHFI